MRAVNLIPQEQRAGGVSVAGHSEGAAYGVLALIAGVALLALIYGIAHHQIASRRSQLSTLNARVQRAQAATAELAPYTSFMALREERLRAVSTLVDSRFDWAHAFHEFGRVLPPVVTLTSLEGNVGSSSGSGSGSSSASKPATGSAASSAGSSSAAASGGASAVASATPPGTVPQFTVSGCALDQAQVADVLTRLRLIDGVSDVTLQSSTKASGGSATGAGTCPGPTFTIGVTFEPLPSPSAIASAKATPASFTGGAR